MIVCVYCAFQNPLGSQSCQNCGASLAITPLQSLGAGSSLQGGKYLIAKPLAQGGFGMTYVATHVALGQTVTIKELFPQNAMRVGSTLQPPTTLAGTWRQAVSGFVQEARTLAGFLHSGIVKVQDVFEENNTAYFVMEYLQGQTLAEKLKNSVFSEAQAGTLARQMAAALREVHAKGLLHRDLKPDNVFLENQRGAVLIDFGSARAFTGQTMQHTQTLTQGYAPPEQYSSSARFGPYTDIYALGATLYTALTGQLPPDAYARVNGVALQFPAHISSLWRDLIDMAMRFKVDERPQTVDAFLAGLPNLNQAVLLPLPTQPVNPMNHLPPTIVSSTPAKPKSAFPMALLAIPVLAVAGWFGYQALPKSGSKTSSSAVNTLISSANFIPTQVEIAPAFLNVRSQPSPDASKVMQGNQAINVVRGETVAVTNERNNWYEVKLQNQTGFVSAKYAIPLEPRVPDSALQKLLEVAKNGGSLKLEAGVYRLPNGLKLSQNIQLEGVGWKETILLSETREATLQSTGGTISLKNLTIAHVGGAPAAAAILRDSSLDFDAVRFIGAKDTSDPNGDDGDGLVVYDVTGEIKNSFFLGNAWRGLSIRGNSSLGISESQFSANSGTGVVIANTAQPNLSRNDISGNGLAGIKIFDQADPVLIGNTISANAKGGIGFSDQSSATLTDNQCAKNGEYAVKIETKRSPNLAENLGCVTNATAPIATPVKPPLVFLENSSTPGIGFAVPDSKEQFLSYHIARNSNLWNMRLARNKNVLFGTTNGEEFHQARAKPLELYTWGVAWCNASAKSLAFDLERIELRLEANGIPLSVSRTFSGAEPTPASKNRHCYRISTFIRGQVGSNARLSAVANVLSPDVDNDGKGLFEVGEHRISLDVLFSGTSSIPAKPLQVASGISQTQSEIFAKAYLSSGEQNSVEVAMQHYAPRVVYYKLGEVSISTILADKLSYFSRWVQRRYWLDSSVQTLQVTANGRKIRFEYGFRVSRSDKSLSGRAYVVLGLIRQAGAIKIIEEGGAVI